eukprot:366122-Chlamydomonas_euryale.AAC.13
MGAGGCRRRPGPWSARAHCVASCAACLRALALRAAQHACMPACTQACLACGLWPRGIYVHA